MCNYALRQKKFGKKYENEEEDKKRMKIYFEKKIMIKEHNEKYERGESTFMMGINKFADMVS